MIFRPVRNFQLAARQVDASFADIHLINLVLYNSTLSDPATIALDVFDLTKNFRHIRRLESHSEIESSIYSAFLVRESSESPSFKGKVKEPLECICDKIIGGRIAFI